MGSRKLVIAVSGQPASGKTTYARYLAGTYGLRYVSSGRLFREYARRLGVSLLELHRIAETDPSIDRGVDSKAVEEARRGRAVIEGHLAAWIVGDLAHLKMYFKAPLEVRIARAARRDGVPLERAKEEIASREESNIKRARDYYGIDLRDWSIFDLVVDTSKMGVEGVKRVLKTFVDEFLARHPELLDG